MAKEIKLINSDKIVLVDDEDYSYLSEYEWKLEKWCVSRKSDGTFIHRLILNLGPVNKNRTNLVDHIDRNILNNQKSNLRICNDQQNSFNTGPNKNTSSIYKGVSKRDDKWVSTIEFNGKLMKLGYYIEEEKAALAYDFMARKLFKEFAYLNFPNIIIDNYYEAVEKSRSKTKKTNSVYIGISNCGNFWSARIKQNGKIYHVGNFASEIDAAKARDYEAIKRFGFNARLNFPNFDYSNYIINNLYTEYTSTYDFIHKCRITGKFKVVVNINKKLTYIGSFEKEIVAAEVADYFNIQNNNSKKLNFPKKDYSDYVLPKGLKKTENELTSKYNCVNIGKHNKFCVNIKINKQNFHVGTFANELDAATTADFWNHKFNKDRCKKVNFPDIIEKIFSLVGPNSGN